MVLLLTLDVQLLKNPRRQTDGQWQASTLLSQVFNVDSCCAVVIGLLILTASNILIKSKVGVSHINLFQYVEVILSLPYQSHWI